MMIKFDFAPKVMGAFLVVFLIATAVAQAGPAPENIKSQEELHNVIATLDAALFDTFNHCQMDKFTAFFIDDVEFYHDRDGLSTGKASLAESLKTNICGKVTRELVAGSLEAYPIPGYGAIEIGVHRFHHPGHDDTEPVGEAKFTHLWRYKDGAWKITRVLSYDHHSLPR